MKPRITVITLGVDDLDRALTFYRDGLGFRTEGVVGREFEHGAVVFFDLEGGPMLALWSRADLAHDTGLVQGPPSSTGFSLGHNVNSRSEVDAVMSDARRAGAGIVKEAGDTFWGGYAGYFTDPDGHLWEVVWNPDLHVED
jgi:catechol 2,3-dioxygenase-like lactoylglutathione lyase family enzyme